MRGLGERVYNPVLEAAIKRNSGATAGQRAPAVALEVSLPPRSNAPRRLVVNADDFGISRGVNRGIVEAHLNGLLTSASLMASLPAAEDAVARAERCPRLALGLHLTLTAGRPLSEPDRVPSLVDTEGRLLVLGRLVARLSLGRVRRPDLERELSAQVEWALERGVRLDHLDSHHHVHVHPAVAGLALRLAEGYGIPYLRCPTELSSVAGLRFASARDAARVLLISLFGELLRQRLSGRRQVQAAAHFRGVALGYGFGLPALLRTLGRLPPGLTELMAHPGYPDAELATVTTYARGRERELAALTSPEGRRLVETLGVRLTTFREAASAAPYT